MVERRCWSERVECCVLCRDYFRKVSKGVKGCRKVVKCGLMWLTQVGFCLLSERDVEKWSETTWKWFPGRP